MNLGGPRRRVGGQHVASRSHTHPSSRLPQKASFHCPEPCIITQSSPWPWLLGSPGRQLLEQRLEVREWSRGWEPYCLLPGRIPPPILPPLDSHPNGFLDSHPQLPAAQEYLLPTSPPPPPIAERHPLSESEPHL